jgi:uroporphyrin-III C-methyltransferase
MTGKVYLVGAGPGDPELLTLKAARVLRNADAVLHDELVAEPIIKLVPRHAQIYDVGKRCGEKKINQEEIHSLMIALAGSGLRVVRLKGGDPLIFGRAGEEIAALRQAKIPFEIVPGITAALGAAAAAEIPLTHRQSSHALVLVAGHSASGFDEIDWPALAATGATVVVYMPGHDYARIVQKLRAAGLEGEIACAIISKATTPEEQVYSTTLEHLADAPVLPTPTLLVIGRVVGQSRHQFLPAELQSAASLGLRTETESWRGMGNGISDKEKA